MTLFTHALEHFVCLLSRSRAKTYRSAALCPQPRAKASGKVVSKGKAAPAVTATVASSGIPAPGSKLPASKLSQPGAAKAGKAKPTPRQAAEAVRDAPLSFALCVFAAAEQSEKRGVWGTGCGVEAAEAGAEPVRAGQGQQAVTG